MSERFSIPNPCHRAWDDLRGNGREKFCDECQTPVYAKEQYSTEEWDRIWRESRGHVCGFLSGMSAMEPRTRRAVLAGALLTAISPLMAQAGRVRVRVTDPADAIVAGAEVSLLGADGKPLQTTHADKAGEMVFTGVPMGDCRIQVSSPGFKTRTLTLLVRNGEELTADARLEIGAITMGTFVEAALPRIGRVRIRVFDQTGHVIPGAQASVLDDYPATGHTIYANDAGEIVVANLSLGDCRIRVGATGFQYRQLTLTLQNSDEVQLETTLTVGTVGTFLAVAPEAPLEGYPALDQLPSRPHRIIVPVYRNGGQD